MSLGSQISALRKNAGMTQAQLAEAVDVTFQAVSSWEHDDYQPDVAHLLLLTKALNTTVGTLVEEFDRPNWVSNERLFNEEHMYTFIKSAAVSKGLRQTIQALPLMKEWHSGQIRDGAEGVPYIIHPLTMACHALAMGVDDDDVIATIILHDVVEDCGVDARNLPVNDTVREAVVLLSYPKGVDKAKIKPAYYAGIIDNPIPCLVKCIDRCNNLSTMASGFKKDKMAIYVSQTEKFVFPLLQKLKDTWVQWNIASWLLSYQIKSLIETYKCIL